jgi:hypothetical protein
MGTVSVDVITGRDGKPRCAWAGADDASVRYHDEALAHRVRGVGRKFF